MIYIEILLLILNSTIFYSIIFKKKFGETLVFTTFTYILMMYIGGLLDNLHIGVGIILLLNVFFLAYNIYSFIKKKVDIKNNILSLGFILYLLSYILIIWATIREKVTGWDEFSHWALIVKNMYGLNNFGIGANSTAIFKQYLSGTSLFQTFCTMLSGEYKEPLLYFGMDLVLISFIIPAFEKFDREHKIKNYLLYFIVLFIPIIFCLNVYTSLLVDRALALCFAYTIYTYLSNRNKDLELFDYINLIVAFAMLIFIKDFGLIMAGLSLLIILIDNIFVMNKFELKTLIKKNYKIVLTIIPALLIKLSWVMTMIRLDINTGNKETGVLSSLIELLKLNIQDYQKATIQQFVVSYGSKDIGYANFKITYAVALGALAVIGYLIYNNQKKNENKKRVVFYTISTIICGFIYSWLLLLCYLSIFSKYEALRLASYQRYMGTFALGSIFAFIILLFYSANNNKEQFKKYIVSLFVVFMITVNFYNVMVLLSGPIYTESLNARKELEEFKDKVYNNVKDDERVFFIATNDSGLYYYVARYEITPKKMNLKAMWSIGNPYNENDIWTYYIEADDLRKMLIDDYDYVFLQHIDDEFIELYGGLFEGQNIENGQLYSIDKKNNANLILVE